MPPKVDVADTRKGPAPTTRDAIRSVPHLAESVAFGLKHTSRHLNSSHEQLHMLSPEDPLALQSIIWNQEHARRHIIEAINHSEKIKKHVDGHPDLSNAVSEDCLKDIMQANSTGMKAQEQALAILDSIWGLFDQVQSGSKSAYDRLIDKYHQLEKALLEARSESKKMTASILICPGFVDEYKLLSIANPMPDQRD